MAGIYIHIPFCKQKCTYCDFHFSTTFHKYRDRMLRAMQQELKDRAGFLKNATVETIYFGGGTPSLLTQNELETILANIQRLFSVDTNAEITLEANPDDCTDAHLKIWKAAGINRLSIGVQSFKASDLTWMNRAHTAQEAKDCVAKAQSHGFENLTVDLMYGLPNLTEEEWRQHVQTVIGWGVPHISSYCLTVEENTILEKRVNAGELKVANDDEQSRQFEILVELLENHDIKQYEISNFSKPGFESKHNSNYWKGVPYLGIGPSAHSYRGNQRQWNVANNPGYMKALEAGEMYWEQEELSRRDQHNESLLTGLRTVYGVSLKKLAELCPPNDAFHSKLEAFIGEEWMRKEGEMIYLTKSGRLRADYIAAELFAG